MSTQIKKEALRLLSLQARDLKQKLIEKAHTIDEAAMFECMGVNDIIIKYFYTDDENQVFHSYKHWQELGFQVKKGSKAFVIWGKKRANIEKERAEIEEKEQYKFFPLAFIFSNSQVEPIEEETPV